MAESRGRKSPVMHPDSPTIASKGDMLGGAVGAGIVTASRDYDLNSPVEDDPARARLRTSSQKSVTSWAAIRVS